MAAEGQSDRKASRIEEQIKQVPAEHLWRSNSGYEHSEVMGVAFQQWQQHSGQP